jgi:hypothetical protein
VEASSPPSYTVTVAAKAGYLHATVTGANTEANVFGYMSEVLDRCRENACPRLLIEERLEGPRLGTLEVFRIASQKTAALFGSMEAIAFVDVNATGDLMKFAQTVARNRGAPVAVFASVEDAERWLAARP